MCQGPVVDDSKFGIHFKGTVWSLEQQCNEIISVNSPPDCCVEDEFYGSKKESHETCEDIIVVLQGRDRVP